MASQLRNIGSNSLFVAFVEGEIRAGRLTADDEGGPRRVVGQSMSLSVTI
jgi:hypothetical protein